MANEFRVRKKLIVNGSGSVILDVQGSQGQLFSVTDSLSGSLFSVKDISGIPVIEAFSDDTVNIGTFNAEAIKVSGSFARITGSLLGSASYALTASYAMNGGGTPIDTSAFATTGSNTFRGNQTVTGSLFTSGSNTLVGVTTLTGSLLVTGSTTQTGNNTLVGNTTLSGSIIISGSSTPGSPTASVQIYGDIRQTGYHRFDPVNTNINTSISASYIYVSGSTNDLYFSQNSAGYSNVTRLRWLEGNLYTGLLNGGLITATNGTTTYQISSGSGIIVNLNASLTNNPYPTIQYLNWGNLTGNISAFTSSFQQIFVGIDSTNNIFAQGEPFNNGQFDNIINIGGVFFQNGSTINAVKTQPSVAYGFEQQQNIFNRAFGPLKLSGYTLAPSGSSTLSLIVASGTAYAPGSNYTIDQNEPSYTIDNGTNVSKIFRYRQSGSTWVYDTNAGAGYTTINPGQYSNNGVLTTVQPNDWSIQRVFWFPNSVVKAIVVYYGNQSYSTEADAIANIAFESFVEAPNTAANAIYLGAIVIKGSGVFTTPADFKIQPGGLFRQVGGAGGGGSVVTQTLAGLSDVAISAPTNGQALVYDTTAAKWQNKSSISASISGNATTATIAATASSADNFTVRGTLTAQTIVAQTITSSTDYVSGSTIFGNSLSNTHQFTGSVSITGSLQLTGDTVLRGSGATSATATLISQNSANAVNGTIYNDGTWFFGGSNTRLAAIAGEFNFNTAAGNISRIGHWGMFFRPIQAGSVSLELGTDIKMLNTNVLIGTTVDSGQRLQVSGSSRFVGNMVITGSATITAGVDVSGTSVFTIGSGTNFRLNGAVGGQLTYGYAEYIGALYYAGFSGTTVGMRGSSAVLLGNTATSYPFAVVNDRVAVGHISPTALLHISGSTGGLLEIDSNTASNILYVSSSGNVGIGTNTPAYKLDLVTSDSQVANFSSTNTGARLRINNTTATPNVGVGLYANGTLKWSLASYGATSDFTFYNDAIGSDALFIKGNTNNVGIGTTTPNAKLEVSGSAIISGSLTATQGITGSLFGTSSWANNAISTSFATTASSADNFVVRGTLTAQTIVAQTITSSTDFVSGSTIFGNILSNTHQFTGSVSITGSLRITQNTSISAGNLSIFTTNTPRRINLQVANGSKAAAIGIEAGGTPHSVIGADTSGTDFLQIASRAGISFYSNSTIGDIVTDPTNERMRLVGNGNLILQSGGTFTDTGERLQVSGSSRFAGNMVITGSASITQALTASAALISGSGTQRLVVVGSGSAQPLFTVQGSQGELFSIVDSLSGSLFSVNDQSGLPIMEVFSDNTILMGNYLDPMLLTTTRTGSAAGINTLYTLPTSSYDAVYIDYTIRSGSNARAGNFMAMWSGTSVNFTDNSITEFGTTSGFIFGAHVTGSNMVVTGSSPTAGWTVKTIIKAI
jgi:hypothetical protein